MARDAGFAEYITEDVLGHIEGITKRAMFSGYGIYLKGKIVGLIIDGTFYVKINKEFIDEYKKEGCEPFEYERPGGKIVTMPYASVPIDVLEDREKISEWIDEAYELSKK